MRNIRNIIPALFMLLFVSCSNKPQQVEGLFSGTTPIFEIDGEIISPTTIYLNFTSGMIEYKGNNNPFSIISESDNSTEIETNLVLSGGITVKRIQYSRQSEKLILETNQDGKNITLEKYDTMIKRKLDEYNPVKLTADISHLSDNQIKMMKKLFEIADIMDGLFWKEACPQKEMLLAELKDPNAIEFFKVNYGPWERLNGNLPFMPDIGQKPKGSGFYPVDMTVEEFEALDNDMKKSLYTIIRRNSNGELEVVPYHIAFSDEIQKASQLLVEAADLAEDPGFEKYLRLRAEALLTDEYLDSDMAWMDMKDNAVDFVVGPIENYEDNLFGYKAAHESFILIKDREWSEKLGFISSLLPKLQQTLPVPSDYKKEVPGSDSDLGAYDVVYYAGDCNASSKTIAINLPNDERVHLEKGSRKLQLKNAIRYKFEEILVPISNVLIAEDQREHIKFDAFFENTMFHEVAHGLGIKNTISGKGTVRNALKEQYSALEEGKADILGLYLVTKLAEMNILKEKDLMDNYVTFMASIFRSVRFGVASSHGKANMIRFYYFQKTGAFTRDSETGTYRIDFEKMKESMNSLAEIILTIQGDGNYEAAKKLVEENGYIKEDLQKDLDRLKALSIPVDIRFEQGPEVLGIE